MLMHDYYHDKLFKVFKMYFTPTSTKHKYNAILSNKDKYYLPLVKTNYGKFNIRFAGATLWNSLDENLKKRKKNKILRANYCISSLVAINRNILIKPLINIFIFNLLSIVFFFLFLLVAYSACYFNFFLLIYIIPIHVNFFLDSFLTL